MGKNVCKEKTKRKEERIEENQEEEPCLAEVSTGWGL